MGGTEVGGSRNAGTGVVSEEEVDGTDMTDVQTVVEIGGTAVGRSVSAGTEVVYRE